MLALLGLMAWLQPGVGLAQRLGQAGPLSDDYPTGLSTYHPSGGVGGRVVVLDIEETIDLGLASFVERAFRDQRETDLYVLRIKTFGGRVDAAVRIRDTVLEAKAKTLAFIDQRAISAGALIALAAHGIVMTPSASIGAATPVQAGPGGEMQATSEKVVSYMRAEMRATAEARGRRADLAEAMVDPDLEIEGVIAAGKLLTLTSEQAVQLGLADAAATSIDDALTLLNWNGAERVSYVSHWGEDLARFLTGPIVSSLLMTLGFLGLMMELYTPGFGIGGLIGLSCLLLFFFGQYSANLAGWEELLLIGIGLLLVALEVLVIPGFGVAGVLGIAAIGTGLAMALVELDVPWDVAYELGYVGEAFSTASTRLAWVLGAVIGGSVLMARFLPGSRPASWLVFRAKPSATDGKKGLGAEAPGSSLDESYAELLGAQGVALTVLRPTGVADFSGRRVHVVADGRYLEVGARVKVTRVEGARVEVDPVES